MPYEKFHVERWLVPGSMWTPRKELYNLTDVSSLGKQDGEFGWKGKQILRDHKLVVLKAYVMTLSHGASQSRKRPYNAIFGMQSDGFVIRLEYVTPDIDKRIGVFPSVPLWYARTTNCVSDNTGWNKTRATFELVQQWRSEMLLVEKGR